MRTYWKIIVMVLAVFATVSVKAQLDEDVQTPDVGEEDTLSLEFGNPTIFAGPSILFYNGDLNKSGKKVGFNASFNYGCDIGFEQRFTKFWGVSAEIGFNRIFHSFDSKPFYSFKTDLYRFQVKNIFLFEDRIAFARVDDFSTFVFVGGGFSKYDTRGDLKTSDGTHYYFWDDGTVRDRAYDPESTDQANIVSRDGKYESRLDTAGTHERNSTTLTLGGGIKYKISNRFEANFSLSYIFANSDMFDAWDSDAKKRNFFNGKNDGFWYSSITIQFKLIDETKLYRNKNRYTTVYLPSDSARQDNDDWMNTKIDNPLDANTANNYFGNKETQSDIIADAGNKGNTGNAGDTTSAGNTGETPEGVNVTEGKAGEPDMVEMTDKGEVSADDIAKLKEIFENAVKNNGGTVTDGNPNPNGGKNTGYTDEEKDLINKSKVLPVIKKLGDDENKGFFGIQIRASRVELPPEFFADSIPLDFSGAPLIYEFTTEDESGFPLKYAIRKFKTFYDAELFNDSLQAVSEGLKSFVIRYHDSDAGEIAELIELSELRIDGLVYRIQIASSQKKVPGSHFSERYKITDKVYVYEAENGFFKYSVGQFETYKQARVFNENFKKKFNISSFITPYFNGKRVPISVIQEIMGKDKENQ